MRKRRHLNKRDDPEFSFVLRNDPSLNEWRVLAAAWYKQQTHGRDYKFRAMDKFLIKYIHGLNLERNPVAFLSCSYQAPDFLSSIGKASENNIKYNNYVSTFLTWVLEENFSIEDGHGGQIIPSEFRNPVYRKSLSGTGRSETHRSTLPYQYIRELRQILNSGSSFRDWKWVQEVTSIEDISGKCAEWFEVDPAVVDDGDPDCVWRKRKINRRGNMVEVTELWSPIRAMLLYIKLELPLRTHQVRMLDSGEADTFRYEAGKWTINQSPMATGTEKRPCHRGIFHRSIDLKTRKVLTGFYINTNKTADINKDESDKGYTIPWQNDSVLFWLEKLRNWQERYNPLSTPTPWASLTQKHFGYPPPHESVLESRGDICFLFRNPLEKITDDRAKPIGSNSPARMWYLLLAELERRCFSRGETLDDGTPIKFVDPDSYTATYYDLHSLRVSLITAYALEGGVPFPILSKLIAGHSRLIMTLYYTKAGKAHVTEVMKEAEKKLLEGEQASSRRFLQELSYQQIENSFAFNSPTAVLAASSQKTSAGFVLEDKGICPVGCGACDIGGKQTKFVKSAPRQNMYAPVPGHPHEKNCVRCRFFITGPAFLPGLIAHFNHLSYQLSECSGLYARFEKQVVELEDLRFECEANNQLFARSAELSRISRLYEQAAQKADKLGNDIHSTIHLIDRCEQLLREKAKGEVKLVPVGGISDISYALQEVSSEMHQLEVICENSVLYLETDSTMATLRRSQILDAMLEINGRKPIFFKLTPEQQLLVGNHVMELIESRAGSLESAVEIAEGHVLLKQTGLLEDLETNIRHHTGLRIEKALAIKPSPAIESQYAIGGIQA